MTDEPINLSAYHTLNEDEFEMEVFKLLNTGSHGAKLLREMAEILRGQADALEAIAENYKELA